MRAVLVSVCVLLCACKFVYGAEVITPNTPALPVPAPAPAPAPAVPAPPKYLWTECVQMPYNKACEVIRKDAPNCVIEKVILGQPCDKTYNPNRVKVYCDEKDNVYIAVRG